MKPEQIDIQAVFAAHPYVREILRRFQAADHEAYLIGGVVRDGVAAAHGGAVPFPPADVDIATSALPSEIRKLFDDRPIVGVGEEFGVLVIVAPEGNSYEVATFRTEGEYDGRWPGKVDLVRDLESDVRRRDLTINGLAATAEGTVVDLVGGIDDLMVRRVRAIGDPGERFREDHLRMLRAVRFVCQIDGELDAATAAAVVESAARIALVSQERVRDELFRTLRTARSSKGFRLLDELGLLGRILPEVSATKGVPQPEEYHPEGDVFVHTLEALRMADRFIADPIVKFAVLLHDIGKPAALERSGGVNMGGHCAIGARMAKTIGERLRLSKEEIRRLGYLVKNHMRVAALAEMGRGKQVRFVSADERPDATDLRSRFPLFCDLLQVLVADSEASAHRASGWRPVLRETLRIAEHIDRVCSLKLARELIDGNVLIELGMLPGPQLGRLLLTLHDRILAGEITSREAAIDAARASIAAEN